MKDPVVLFVWFVCALMALALALNGDWWLAFLVMYASYLFHSFRKKESNGV